MPVPVPVSVPGCDDEEAAPEVASEVSPEESRELACEAERLVAGSLSEVPAADVDVDAVPERSDEPPLPSDRSDDADASDEAELTEATDDAADVELPAWDVPPLLPPPSEEVNETSPPAGRAPSGRSQRSS